MRIVFWAWIPFLQAAVTQTLEDIPDIDVTIVETIEDLATALPGADALVLIDPPLALARAFGALLRAPTTTLRWMHVLSAGREGIIEADVPAGIVMTGPSGAHAPTLAEHVMGFMFAFTRRTPEFARMTDAHAWDRTIRTSMSSLEECVLLIVGLGNSGQALAARARPYGMTVLAVTRTPKEHPDVAEVHPLSNLRTVLGRADFIAVTIAQTPETYHLFGAAEFAACKPTAFFINIARGGIVDQPALVAALHAGQLAGAGLDVTDPEPPAPDDPLWDAPNVIVSPHCAGGTSRLSVQRLTDRIIENLAKFRNGTLVPTT